MEEQNIDANTALDSSSFDAVDNTGFDDLSSTVENLEAIPGLDDSSEGDETLTDTPGQEKPEEEVDDGLQAKEDQPSGDLHENPRFKELVDKKNELFSVTQQQQQKIAQLEGRLDGITQVSPQAQAEPEKLDYIDVTTLTEDQLRDMMEDDPKGYTANLARQVRHEMLGEFNAASEKQQRGAERQSFDTRQKDGLRTYYDANKASFDKHWKAEAIQNLIRENPAHNLISAHMELSRDELKSDISKQAKDKVLTDIKVKGRASSLSGKPSTAGGRANGIAPELKDPDKYGGIDVVLARRQQARMAGKL